MIQTLVRSALLLALGPVLAACGPGTVIELTPPLAIVDTFPANGATLPGTSVTHIDVVFSEQVPGSAALAALSLVSVDESDEVDARYSLQADPEHGEDGFDAELQTFSVLIGEPSTTGELPDGESFRLAIQQGLTAANGSVLPVDVIRRFATRSP